MKKIKFLTGDRRKRSSIFMNVRYFFYLLLFFSNFSNAIILQTYFPDWVPTGNCYIGLPFETCKLYCAGFDSSETVENRVARHPNANPDLGPDYPQWACQIKSKPLKCPPPYSVYLEKLVGNPLYNFECRVTCPLASQWDKNKQQCISPPATRGCKTTSRNPIDFSSGEKYRVEGLMTAGTIFPIVMDYFYSSNNGGERTSFGSQHFESVITAQGPYVLLPNVYPITQTEYESNYAHVMATEKLNLVKGNVTSYWRHTYESSLTFATDSEEVIWHKPSGEDISFDAAGKSKTYSTLVLKKLVVSEYGFDGYSVDDDLLKKVFDIEGRLKRIENKAGLYQELTYDSAFGYLKRITHSLGYFVDFEYESREIKSAFSPEVPLTRYYPVKIVGNSGLSVVLEWGHQFEAGVRNHNLITYISEPYTDQPMAGRYYEYNNIKWRSMLTDIYTATNQQLNTKTLYAHFEYDDQGRAIYSGLNDGVDAISLDYPDSLTRVVTNALGKRAVYDFLETNGVRRLKKVSGEATPSCAPSNVEYTYDSFGNVSSKLENGRTTLFSYDNRGLETSRTEAFGLPEERTITTEWHPTLNLPTKITEPKRETIIQYDAQGREVSRSVNQL